MMTKILVKEMARFPFRRWGMVGSTYPASVRFQRVMEALFNAARPDIEWVGECLHDMAGYQFDPIRTLDWIDEVQPEAVFAPILGPGSHDPRARR